MLNLREILVAKKALFSVALFALLVLFGCVSPPGGGQIVINDTEGPIVIINDTGPVVINVTGMCEDLTEPHARDNCYFNKISKDPGGDVSTCYNIKDNRLRDRCIYLLGVKNMEFCPQISAESLDLRDDCFYSNAESSGKDIVCLRIRNETIMKKCQSALAQKACSGLDEYNATFCLAVKTKNPALCAGFVNESQICYFNLAINLSDTSICENVKNAIPRKACEAIILNTPDICTQLTYDTEQDACYYTFAVEKNNETICDRTTTVIYINLCHGDLALKNNKPSLCEQLYTEPDREKCYRKVAVKYFDLGICDKIKLKEWRDGCRHEMAISASRPYYCGFIENDYMRVYDCYTQLFLPGKYNITLQSCSEIRDDDIAWRDQCYLSLYNVDKNSSICNYIQTDAIKSRCV